MINDSESQPSKQDSSYQSHIKQELCLHCFTLRLIFYSSKTVVRFFQVQLQYTYHFCYHRFTISWHNIQSMELLLFTFYSLSWLFDKGTMGLRALNCCCQSPFIITLCTCIKSVKQRVSNCIVYIYNLITWPYDICIAQHAWLLIISKISDCFAQSWFGYCALVLLLVFLILLLN